MKRPLRWPSPSMVVALMALFVALGGTGYALTITGKNVKNSSLTGADIKNNSVRGADIKNNSVRSADVAGLRATDFTAGQLPAGPQGPRGETGPAGPATGPAGGALTGSYPNPGLADGAVTTSKLGAIPSARAFRADAPSVPSGSPTTNIGLDSELFDTAGLHDNATNNERLVAPVTGVYVISGYARWGSSAVGSRFIALGSNATGGPRLAQDWRPAATITGQTVTTIAKLNVGEYVFLEVFQDSGAPLDVGDGQAHGPHLAMTWVAPG